MCFGDSNTYGYNPKNGGRYTYDERWTGLLQKKLGDKYYVIEEGLNGRTTVFDDPIDGDLNGKKHILTCMNTHSPLDLVILMLGTNDFKPRFSATTDDISRAIELLITMVKNVTPCEFMKVPEILLIAPAPFKEIIAPDMLIHFGNANLRARSIELAYKYENAAKTHNIHYLRAGDIATDIDGVHIAKKNQSVFAELIYNKLKDIAFTK